MKDILPRICADTWGQAVAKKNLPRIYADDADLNISFRAASCGLRAWFLVVLVRVGSCELVVPVSGAGRLEPRTHTKSHERKAKQQNQNHEAHESHEIVRSASSA